MLSSRPLYDTLEDADYFVATRAWPRLSRAVDLDFNVAIVGPPGSGKTTLLRQLQRSMHDQNRRVAFIDATGVESAAELISLASEASIGRSGFMQDLHDDLSFVASQASAGPPGSASIRLVERIRALGQQPPTVFLVDSPLAAKPVHDLFGRLRDELWHLSHQWVVTVNESDRARLLAPPADAFFDQTIVIDWLSADLVDVLARRHLDLENETQASIAGRTATPRRALQAARDALTSGGNGQDLLEDAFWRHQEASKLGRPHSLALAELERLDGASASDEELLSRLGWTRARASQVLNELAAAKIVVGFDERFAGNARPRRVFRPAASPASKSTQQPKSPE